MIMVNVVIFSKLVKMVLGVNCLDSKFGILLIMVMVIVI